MISGLSPSRIAREEPEQLLVLLLEIRVPGLGQELPDGNTAQRAWKSARRERMLPTTALCARN
jgi:hypothetical protein